MTDKQIDDNLKYFEEKNLIYTKKVDHFHVTGLKGESWNEKEEMVNMEMEMEMKLLRSPDQPWHESYGMPNTIKSEKM